MADTMGGLIDKMITIDLKMWNNQELLYEIRKMTFEEYKEKYFDTIDGAKILWDIFKKSTDLNVQRNQLIDEFDERLIDLLKRAINGEELDDGKNIQRKHKTY
jgi:RNAse (barnase) inhibitor barstar